MTNTELERALELSREAVTATGANLRRFYGNVEALTKGDGNGIGGTLTELDQQTEQFLAKALGKFSSSVGFRGEEFGVHASGGKTWLVDPIDGTHHFVRGMPFCTTMVSLIDEGQVVLAVINDFVRDDTYWAIRGQGAFCNDKPIAVSDRTLHQGLVSFETKVEKPENCEKYVAVRQKTGVVATVSCGFEFAMIASGKLDGRIALDPYGMDWDFAPGSLLVSEAGGVAANIGSSEYDYTNHDYIIANPTIYAELTTGPDAIFPIPGSNK